MVVQLLDASLLLLLLLLGAVVRRTSCRVVGTIVVGWIEEVGGGEGVWDDSTALSLCMDNGLPIVVFDLMGEGNILRAVRGEKIGTLVSPAGR